MVGISRVATGPVRVERRSHRHHSSTHYRPHRVWKRHGEAEAEMEKVYGFKAFAHAHRAASRKSDRSQGRGGGAQSLRAYHCWGRESRNAGT